MAEMLKALSGVELNRRTETEGIFPISGYLFKKGSLVGIYVGGKLIMIEEVLPSDIQEGILRGKIRGSLRILLTDCELKKIRLYFSDGIREWLISEKNVEEVQVGPGGFEPPTTRL